MATLTFGQSRVDHVKTQEPTLRGSAFNGFRLVFGHSCRGRLIGYEDPCGDLIRNMYVSICLALTQNSVARCCLLISFSFCPTLELRAGSDDCR
jgi:hypothetical protein